MPAITDSRKMPSQLAAELWLKANGYSKQGTTWMDGGKRWARCEPLPSGRVLVKIGVC